MFCFAQKMAARLRSSGTQPVAGENVGGTPVEGESSSNVPAGLCNLFAGGVGSGVRFGLGIVSSNLGHRGMPTTPFWAQSSTRI